MVTMIWGLDNIGKTEVRRNYEIPWKRTTSREEGAWLYQNQPQDLVIGWEMVVSSGVEWPLLELVESQPICWFIYILGIKGLCSQMKIYCFVWELSKQVHLSEGSQDSHCQKKGNQSKAPQNIKQYPRGK